jgi:protein-tyrosine phosphatase
MTGRIHRFDALDNFRDYGDYAAGGRHVARGRLFRSAHQARVTDADLERLAALGIGTVVDLRRPGERRDQPSRRPAGWIGQVLASDLGEDGEAPHITFLKTSDLTIDAGRRFMTGVYRNLPFEPAHLDLFARYFRALGETDGAVLIHCAAGKDRTGILAALTHRLLGVHPDDMVADYLLTNTAVDLDRLAPKVARQLQAMTGREPSHDAVVAFLGVEPVYLETALAEIRARHGSVDAYLETALGVDARLRDRIGERLSA